MVFSKADHQGHWCKELSSTREAQQTLCVNSTVHWFLEWSLSKDLGRENRWPGRCSVLLWAVHHAWVGFSGLHLRASTTLRGSALVTRVWLPLKIPHLSPHPRWRELRDRPRNKPTSLASVFELFPVGSYLTSASEPQTGHQFSSFLQEECQSHKYQRHPYRL